MPLMILSSKGANLFVKTFEKLEKTHKGKFHEMPSLKKAVLTDMLQELIDSKIIIFNEQFNCTKYFIASSVRIWICEYKKVFIKSFYRFKKIVN